MAWPFVTPGTSFQVFPYMYHYVNV